MKKLLLAWTLCLIAIICMFLAPTGYVVSTPGQLIPVTDILEPEMQQATIYIPTVYVKEHATLTSRNSIQANALSTFTALLSADEQLVRMDEFRSEEDDLYALLAQEELASTVVPFVVALNTLKKSFWIDGEGVIALANSTDFMRNDLIVSANRHVISSLDELLQREYLDEELTLIVLRDRQQVIIRNPDMENAALATYRPTIGTNTALHVKPERDFIGRSGDLALALYVHEVLGDKTTTCNVAATGALRPDGKLVAVLEVEQKVRAVQQADIDLFIMPAENAQKLQDVQTEFMIVGAETFTQALEALRSC